jgi:hypothetical protein
MKSFDQQLSMKILLIYMISALLFLTSVELHIHTQKAAAFEDHGVAVAISSLSSELMPPADNGEIKINHDGVLKLPSHTFNFLAVIILAVLLVATSCYRPVTRLQIFDSTLPALPFHGSPSLRAPPQ